MRTYYLPADTHDVDMSSAVYKIVNTAIVNHTSVLVEFENWYKLNITMHSAAVQIAIVPQVHAIQNNINLPLLNVSKQGILQPSEQHSFLSLAPPWDSIPKTVVRAYNKCWPAWSAGTPGFGKYCGLCPQQSLCQVSFYKLYGKPK